ncbi:MAG: DNA-directed RNA polymerase subunit omega [Firmicutes bacterium]|jgi:DNA-directed RNA polymerase subunit omega|nr:DNA-directed RNA polymerase subunit omega [Bacillota bacterium]
MITPSLEELLKRVDSQYTLVIATAKRARQINAQGGEDNSIRAVSLALDDILSGRVQIEKK